MADVTVRQFAESIGERVDEVLRQLQEAGLKQKAYTDVVSDEEKQQLLANLKRKHGEKREKPRDI